MLKRLRKSFAAIRETAPYLYAQWLIEDGTNRDYKVVAADGPEGDDSFEVAHRTGVIGQVFRTAKPVWIGNTKAHPLYDPFDDRVTWELTIPALAADGRMAVLNLEGQGRLPRSQKLWTQIAETIQAATSLCAAKEPPKMGDVSWLQTHFLHADPGAGERPDATLLELVKALTARGDWVLLLGHLSWHRRPEYPTLAEAKARGLSPSYCVYNWNTRIDVLPFGEVTPKAATDYLRECRELAAGRYHWAISLGETGGKTRKQGNRQPFVLQTLAGDVSGARSGT